MDPLTRGLSKFSPSRRQWRFKQTSSSGSAQRRALAQRNGRPKTRRQRRSSSASAPLRFAIAGTGNGTSPQIGLDDSADDAENADMINDPDIVDFPEAAE